MGLDFYFAAGYGSVGGIIYQCPGILSAHKSPKGQTVVPGQHSKPAFLLAQVIIAPV